MLLDYDHPSLFTLQAVPESPYLDRGRPAIRINARNVSCDRSRLRFELLVRYSFPRSFCKQFQRLGHALSMTLEDAAAPSAAIAQLVDPHKRYTNLVGPNFTPAPGLPASDPLYGGGWIAVPVDAPIVLPPYAGPSFFATVFLQRHVSNTLAFDVLQGRATSFLDGSPWKVTTEEEAAPADAIVGEGDEGEDEDEDEPVPAPAAIPAPPRSRALTLTPRTPGPYRAGAPVLLDGALALEPAELETGGPDGWLRSVFVYATRRDSQQSGFGHWVEERVVFHDDGTRGTAAGGGPRALFALPFELNDMLGGAPPEGLYDVQISARQHRSEVIQVELR